MASQKAENLAAFGNRLMALSEVYLIRGADDYSVPANAVTSIDAERSLESLEDGLRLVSEMLDMALSTDEELGIEAYALLSIVYKHFNTGADGAKIFIGTNDEDAVGMIDYGYRRAHEITYPAVEILGAKLVAKSQFEEKNLWGVPLSGRAQRVYEIILSHQPIMGKDIIAKLDEEPKEDINALTESELRGPVMRDELKPLRGIVNKAGAGYYDPHSYDPKKDARK